MGGAVETLDLHLRLIDSGPQVEDRQRGVVDPEPSEAVLWFTEQGEHQTAENGVVGHHQHRAVLVNGVTFDQAIHEGAGLIHELHQRAIAAAIPPLQFQL